MSFLKRPMGKIAYSSGDRVTLEIPREHWLLGLDLHFEGTIDITQAATLHEDQPFSLLRNIEVIAGGKDTFRNVDPLGLLQYNKMFYNAVPLVTKLANGNVEDGKAVSFDLSIDFCRSILDVAGMLPTFMFGSLELAVNWNTISSIITAGAAHVATGEITVTSREITRGPNVKVEGFTVQLTKRRDATGQGLLELELDRGDVYLNEILIVRNNGLRADDFIDEFKLVQDGIYSHYTMKPHHIMARMAQVYQVSRDTGLFVLDHNETRDGRYSIDSAGMSTLKITVDVNKAPTAPASVLCMPLVWQRVNAKDVA